MKNLPPKSRRFMILLASLLVLAAREGVKADVAAPTVYVGNLSYVYPDSAIGDIHNLFPGGIPNGTDTARFVTGTGNGFQLNAITFELLGGAPQNLWGHLSIQLFQQSGNVLLGSLGNPMVNPQPTQWPGSTTFVDFSPLVPVVLNPLTEYSVVLSVPADSPTTVPLLFTRVGTFYTTPTDWSLRTTVSGNPSAFGETLIMAVAATPVPEPTSLALITMALITAGLYLVQRGVNTRV